MRPAILAFRLEEFSGGRSRDYCKSGKLPPDIPANPYSVYRDRGWGGRGDWLGTGTIATRNREYRPFRQARAFVRSLGLKSRVEWQTYSKSGKRPPDIPGEPGKVYRDQGWAGERDWLGTPQRRKGENKTA